jgi:GH24 family phage-related lysozyme (muramidase)
VDKITLPKKSSPSPSPTVSPGELLGSEATSKTPLVQAARLGHYISQVSVLPGGSPLHRKSEFTESQGLSGILQRQTAPASPNNGSNGSGNSNNTGSKPGGPQKISPEGIEMIKFFEGFRANAYIDAVGVPTIGYGTTQINGKPVQMGTSISEQEATKLMAQDLGQFENTVNRAVKVAINNNQFSAMVSFTYNVGSGAFTDSTLLKKLNQGDYSGAANEFGRWVHGDGKVLPGLVTRRAAEKAMFEGGDWRAAANAAKQSGGSGSGSGGSNTSGPIKLSNPLRTGDDVKQVQEALIKKGYSIEADGVFGPKTDQAVKAFQKAEGLTVDGIVGPQTLAKLTASSSGSNQKEEPVPQNTTPASSGTASSGNLSRTLKLTNPFMKGEDVKQVQQKLSQRGISVDVDGVYGPDTKTAVQTFQRQNGLEVDGIVGPQTWAALSRGGAPSSAPGQSSGGKQNAPSQNAPKQNTSQQNPQNQVDLGSINWNNPGTKISTYFTVGEVTKGDPARIPTDPTIAKRIVDFARELDRVRDVWGSGLGVTSWYRPPAVNAAVGGVANSQHIEGWAADVYPTNGKLAEFQSWIDKKWNGGLGYGAPKGFVHLDARSGFPCFGEKGSGPRWNY